METTGEIGEWAVQTRERFVPKLTLVGTRNPLAEVDRVLRSVDQKERMHQLVGQMPCLHPEHNPPMHIVLSPGQHEFRCPACGHKTLINQPRIVW